MSGPTLYLDGRVAVHAGDCLAVVKTLADNSIDACVTDPPYALVSIVKRFGKTALTDETDTSDRSRKGADGYARLAKGFMGKAWDNGSTAFAVEFWGEVWRVLKPGAHVVAFCGTRSYHRLACAIEDAGFEIRDQLAWTYGSGFPKSHDVSKGIDRHFGLDRKRVLIDASQVRNPKASGGGRDGEIGATRPFIETARERGFHEAVSDEAVSFQGWGTALKPAWEPICLARKPLSEGSVAANVLRWGTGAINIKSCRVGSDGGCAGAGAVVFGDGLNGTFAKPIPGLGRWPANLVHDNSPEVLAAFPDVAAGSDSIRKCSAKPPSIAKGQEYERESVGHSDSAGSAARFFYSAKADSDDRLGSRHPTVKPVDLMQYLCRLVCPPGGTILDCFAGTGTTGEAAWREGFNAVLIEREAEYLADIARRMALASEGQMTRKHESAKARTVGKPDDHGPLFGGVGLRGGQTDIREIRRPTRTIGPIGLKR